MVASQLENPADTIHLSIQILVDEYFALKNLGFALKTRRRETETGRNRTRNRSESLTWTVKLLIIHNAKAYSSNIRPETSPGDGIGGVRGVSPQILARNLKTDRALFLPNLQFTILIVKFMISATEDEDTQVSLKLRYPYTSYKALHGIRRHELHNDLQFVAIRPAQFKTFVR